MHISWELWHHLQPCLCGFVLCPKNWWPGTTHGSWTHSCAHLFSAPAAAPNWSCWKSLVVTAAQCQYGFLRPQGENWDNCLAWGCIFSPCTVAGGDSQAWLLQKHNLWWLWHCVSGWEHSHLGFLVKLDTKAVSCENKDLLGHAPVHSKPLGVLCFLYTVQG